MSLVLNLLLIKLFSRFTFEILQVKSGWIEQKKKRISFDVSREQGVDSTRTVPSNIHEQAGGLIEIVPHDRMTNRFKKHLHVNERKICIRIASIAMSISIIVIFSSDKHVKNRCLLILCESRNKQKISEIKQLAWN